MPSSRYLTARILVTACIVTACPTPGPAADRRLALDLAGERQHALAALEFRRLALAAGTPAHQSGYFWAAAQQYHAAGDSERTRKMLDYAEDADPALLDMIVWLRLESALQEDDRQAARFHAQSLAAGETPPLRTLARLALAELAVRQGDIQIATSELPDIPQAHDMQKAIDVYAAGRDRSPRLGGMLGIVPGLGYAYAGEYANALRSLLLNAIFIYGMVETAERDQWGAFAVITFLEITWYSGSIYGGIDAAHRFNRHRLQACIHVIRAPGFSTPVYEALPSVTLRYTF